MMSFPDNQNVHLHEEIARLRRINHDLVNQLRVVMRERDYRHQCFLHERTFHAGSPFVNPPNVEQHESHISRINIIREVLNLSKYPVSLSVIDPDGPETVS